MFGLKVVNFTGNGEMQVAIGFVMDWVDVMYLGSRVEKHGGMWFCHLRVSPNRKIVISGCFSRKG